MKLEKALKILSIWEQRIITTEDQDYKEALGLGIEALKWVLDVRHIVNTPNPELLPGETEE